MSDRRVLLETAGDPEVTADRPPGSVDDPGATSEDDALTAIPRDDLFHVLQNERRRLVLRYVLQNRPGPFEMRTIAEAVAAHEHDTTVRALSSDERQRVYIALYQSHLPKLDQHGLIAYDQNRGVVEERPAIDQTAPYLSLSGAFGEATDDADSGTGDTDRTDVRAGDDSTPAAAVPGDTRLASLTGRLVGGWRRYYAVASLLALLLVGWAWLGPTPAGGTVVATLVATSLVGLTAAWFVLDPDADATAD